MEWLRTPGVGTIDNPITRDVLSSNSHCDLDSAMALTKASAAGGQRTTNRDYIEGIAFLMKKKTMGCDCQHFFVSPPPLIQSLFTNCQLQHRVRCMVCALFLIPPFDHVNSMATSKILLIAERNLIDLFFLRNSCGLSQTSMDM